MNRFLLILIMVVANAAVYGQKFYYEGGYFEKVGGKWYEYKPEKKDGVWNWFTETGIHSDLFYIIDNGNCQVAVPKSPSNDFLIKLKGSDQWQFKYKSVRASDSRSSAGGSARRIARDRSAFHHAYFNEGGVCILASYCLLLEYGNSTNDVISDFDSYDVMSRYMDFHNTLEKTTPLSAGYLRGNHKDGEIAVSKAINNYCMARGWSGYVQVRDFHNWLRGNSAWAAHIEVVEQGIDRLGRKGNTTEGLPFAFDAISGYLDKNLDSDSDCDYAALLTFYLPEMKMFHAIMLGRDKQGYFMRGPNFYDKFTDTVCDFNFEYNADSRIVDYLVVKIARPDAAKCANKWKTFDANRFPTKEKVVNYKPRRVLANPLKVKSIRLDPENGKKASNNNKSAKLRLVSASDSSYVLELGYSLPERTVQIDNEYKFWGRRTVGGLIEYDLGQLCSDLMIESFTPGFCFDNFYFQ